MKISELFKNKKTVVSFEVFPPNTIYSLEDVYSSIDELAKLQPDFMSVTYGAGGATRGRTVEIASKIKNDNKIEALAHLTLRVDKPKDGVPVEEWDFKYAQDLISYVKGRKDFSIGGAYYPEGHQETNDLLDLFNLKTKVDSATDFLISQIFFDNESFYRFRDKVDKLQINVPLVAGIMPVANAKQIRKITSMCGCSIPEKFQKILNRYEDNPKALKEAGTAYATEQIIDLITSDIDGIHLYTMNKVDTAKKIMANIAHIREISGGSR